ncbi:hypothetical protein ACQP3J_31270, partial [Escherichia coli]
LIIYFNAYAIGVLFRKLCQCITWNFDIQGVGNKDVVAFGDGGEERKDGLPSASYAGLANWIISTHIEDGPTPSVHWLTG